MRPSCRCAGGRPASCRSFHDCGQTSRRNASAAVGKEPAIEVARIPVDEYAAEIEDDGGGPFGSLRRMQSR